jgi:hypothetical protein
MLGQTYLFASKPAPTEMDLIRKNGGAPGCGNAWLRWRRLPAPTRFAGWNKPPNAAQKWISSEYGGAAWL